MKTWGELIDNLERRYKAIFEDELSNDGAFPAIIDPFHERAVGFRRAADLIVDQVDENYTLYSVQMIPAALALYRHAIELYLKSIRTLMAQSLGAGYSIDKSHDLKELWQPIESYLKSVGFLFEDGHLHYRVARLVEEFASIDGWGDRFRYPDSRHPHARAGIGMRFKELKLSVAELDLLNFGFPDVISHFERKL